MDDTIVLGGDIVLIGFSEVEPIKLIVVKKIIGRYAKELSEKKDNDGLEVELKSKGDKFTIIATVKVKTKRTDSATTTDNLFTSMDLALKSLQKKFV